MNMVTNQLDDPTLWRPGSYIAGRWQTEAESTLVVSDPATGQAVASLPKANAADALDAVEAADRARRSWGVLPAKERSKILRRWFDLVTANGDDLARIIVLEQGKPFAEARGEVAYAASFIEWFAEEAKRVRGDVMAAPEIGRRIVVLKEPVGVCAAITPWNFPAAMITRKAAPALAAGCTMVVKPAEQTPMTALALAGLAERAGVPEGVLSVIVGDASEIGPVMTGDPRVRKISFTGSTEVGRLLLRESAETIKKSSMELGGNAPVVVFSDADIALAVDAVVATKFRNTGQACISANRVYVADEIFDDFAERLVERVRLLKVGSGFEDGVQQGPMIDEDAIRKVEAHISDAVARGASVLCGGSRHERAGLFFEPTVLANVAPNSLVSREETFGPVTPLIRFASEQEVIALANESEFGLAGYIFTQDAQRAWQIAAALEVGMVGINTGLISNETAPFGGVKQSGLGREGSVYGIEEYLELKYLAWEGAGTNSELLAP